MKNNILELVSFASKNVHKSLDRSNAEGHALHMQ